MNGSDAARLAGYVSTWRSAVDDVLALLRDLEPADWSRPTDLAGWDVRAVAAHLAHLEAELAGMPQDQVEVPEDLPHVRSLMAAYTEAGVIARRDREPAEIIDELSAAADARAAEFADLAPADGAGVPPRTPGGIGWDWETLLGNRPLDVAMHEQDVRRAVGRPGNLDSAGVAHCVTRLTPGMAFVWGKKAQAAAGQTLRLVVTGPTPADLAFAVGDDGRARPVEVPADPTVTLTMDTEAFLVLAGGRRSHEDVDVTVEGDPDLAARVLDHLAVTP
ncbi:MAG: maleylpyruvate isomerase family mycothiol-dependent enzyme [Nocardioides sp.]|nr:maleylpyruvate isomerase family mycothiol-dependent enzyme [Nocardioides sp.]